MNKRFKGISMFSSAGIAETYLEKCNCDILLANELIKERADYYKHFYPSVKMITGDIQDEKVYSKYIKYAKSLNPDFLLATPPCQGMSTLGKKEYKDDERNYLIFSVIEIIKNMDFKFIIIENVPKFLNLLFPFQNDFYTIEQILNSLFGSKYIIETKIYNAKDYGVPQSRPRAIIKMYKKSLISWDEPKIKEEITLQECIGHLPSLESGESSNISFHYALQHSEMQVEAMAHTQEGKSAMTNDVYYPRKKNGDKVKGFHNTYKRMKWNQPCPARATNNGLISGHNNVHPGRFKKDGTVSDARALTLLELFIVSSLPQDWSLPENYNNALVRTLIGEAIPPQLLYEIMNKIRIEYD